MPFVKGFLRIRRRRPGRPGQGLPGEEEDMTPDWGLDEGEPPQIEPPDPDDAPPGIWPPPTIGHPIVPVPPEGPGQGLPPGGMWPRPPSPVEGKFVVLAHVPDHGWRYFVIDPDAWPEPPAGGVGRPPERPTPDPIRR